MIDGGRTRVVVTGAAGLLGTWLRRTPPPDVDVVPLVHRTRTGHPAELAVDLRDRAATLEALQTCTPELVIHTAYAKDEASIVEATGNVAEAAAAAGAGVVHVSTDSVFHGDGVPRSEDDDPDPVSDYGHWKAETERIVRHIDPNAVVVRLPLLVSVEPADHIAAAILDGATGGRPTTWFTDEVRQPAMAEDVAAAIWRIAALDPDRRRGAWHLAGPERLTRHALALRILAALDLPDDVIVATPSPPEGARPRDLHLTDERARREIGWSPSPVLR